MARHWGCKSGRECRVVRAYVRVKRTKWVPVGHYYTGCDKFDSDVAIEKRRKDPEQQRRMALILARLGGKHE
jgi:hypothetical protein